MDFLKLLFDKLMALHGKHADGPEENRFPRPSFKVRREEDGCNGLSTPAMHHALAGSWQQLMM